MGAIEVSSLAQTTAERLREIRLRQPPMSSEELASQIRANRSNYAKRSHSGNGKHCGIGRIGED